MAISEAPYAEPPDIVGEVRRGTAFPSCWLVLVSRAESPEPEADSVCITNKPTSATGVHWALADQA